ncbi:MAG: cation transporter, partial [Legionellales bacterium]|nr:cation transporter [Legionellales bacterium]
MSSSLSERKKIANKTIIVGAIVNIFLAITKIAAGVIGNSNALIADGIHSASDLATDGVVYLAARFGQKAADRDHPYGHRK